MRLYHINILSRWWQFAADHLIGFRMEVTCSLFIAMVFACVGLYLEFGRLLPTSVIVVRGILFCASVVFLC